MLHQGFAYQRLEDSQPYVGKVLAKQGVMIVEANKQIWLY